jgi:hypothetical protein
MRFTVLASMLAAAQLATSSPIYSGNSTIDISSCLAKMDGKLPYYQPKGFNFSGNIRRYYVAAEVDTWDYAPSSIFLSSLCLARR